MWNPEPEPNPPEGGWKLPIGRPNLSYREREAVLDALNEGQISGATAPVAVAERAFADYVGTRFAVACNSGGSALHLMIRALGYPPGSEIIVPSFTMVATAAVVSLAGHVPVFVDCEPKRLTIDPEKIADAVTLKTRAIVVVHLYGHSADMNRVHHAATLAAATICQKVDVLEDAAEAHGAEYGDKRCGSLGHAAAFGFYGNKVLTCGEGGMVTTDDEVLAANVRQLRGYCFDPRYHYWHAELGHSMRMPGLQAAMLSDQIARADALLNDRMEKVAWWFEELPADKFETCGESPDCRSCWWHWWCRVNDRPTVRAALAVAGYETRPGFAPMHVQPCYRDTNIDAAVYSPAAVWPSRALSCPEAELAGREVLLLPTHCGVERRHVREVAAILRPHVRPRR